ncbi:hypothetical protein TGVAND_435540 [Toxoplasma gondii VAND]|uniref:Uncharacterized protein n=1 Tax=Toxoplasma gondii VAND TaxID=933077 RepID=A0A086QIV0_TOXGO|nr:hypothetical protein TGVAND_435540 [Toxoplasma gondii VAND]
MRLNLRPNVDVYMHVHDPPCTCTYTSRTVRRLHGFERAKKERATRILPQNRQSSKNRSLTLTCESVIVTCARSRSLCGCVLNPHHLFLSLYLSVSLSSSLSLER